MRHLRNAKTVSSSFPGNCTRKQRRNQKKLHLGLPRYREYIKQGYKVEVTITQKKYAFLLQTNKQIEKKTFAILQSLLGTENLYKLKFILK